MQVKYQTKLETDIVMPILSLVQKLDSLFFIRFDKLG